ncbi:unnamed protein product [Closterium sp. Naga37s-1]|nr:unnamed protein product [Closterium sp. Naga37s-1]
MGVGVHESGSVGVRLFSPPYRPVSSTPASPPQAHRITPPQHCLPHPSYPHPSHQGTATLLSPLFPRALHLRFQCTDSHHPPHHGLPHASHRALPVCPAFLPSPSPPTSCRLCDSYTNVCPTDVPPPTYTRPHSIGALFTKSQGTIPPLPCPSVGAALLSPLLSPYRTCFSHTDFCPVDFPAHTFTSLPSQLFQCIIGVSMAGTSPRPASKSPPVGLWAATTLPLAVSPSCPPLAGYVLSGGVNGEEKGGRCSWVGGADGWGVQMCGGCRWVGVQIWVGTDGWGQMGGGRWVGADGWGQMGGGRWVGADGWGQMDA